MKVRPFPGFVIQDFLTTDDADYTDGKEENSKLEIRNKIELANGQNARNCLFLNANCADGVVGVGKEVNRESNSHPIRVIRVIRGQFTRGDRALLRFVDQFGKLRKEISGIVRTRCRFGMVLHTKDG